MRHYSAEPKNPARYTARRALLYTWVARPYDVAVRLAPVWRTWLLKVLPAVRGPRVLEVSVGTGYLLTQYPREIEVHGLDIAEGMVQTARRNARRAGTVPRLVRADVAALPYIDGAFDSVVSTMAFTGYADGVGALAEMTRVLRPGGRLVMLDVNYPVDGNWVGTILTELWKWSGDVIRDMGPLFGGQGLSYTDTEVGGCGSVHLYVAEREADP